MSADLSAIAVRGTDRAIMAASIDMVSLRHTCEAIGLAVDSQRRKLRSRSWATVTQEVSVAEDGKPREMTMIDRRTLTMWLATIDENRVSDEARPVLIAFQAGAADALDAYFHEGGAINPNATEDQLARVIGHAREQMEVLQLARGVIDPKHLEAKARIVLARALGEAPEIAPRDMPLYVYDYLKSKGLGDSLVEAKASGFGKRLKALYIVEHDRAPITHPQSLSGGRVAQVCSYTEADRPLFDKVWARHYANVVAA
ncbi:phage antirepressor [Mycobacteroides abscessus]|uniref:Phage antirepressor n=1 Tax=Mycobacteroides abscessus TaxID=36809 RepID=A0ABD7HIM1_9MYCO|nr:phage antirepressor N-terminal domain-containing protein [Mycobacteroides abscessus]RIT32703.1 phage antirepressor [Mycobacteroides abscessus]